MRPARAVAGIGDRLRSEERLLQRLGIGDVGLFRTGAAADTDAGSPKRRARPDLATLRQALQRFSRHDRNVERLARVHLLDQRGRCAGLRGYVVTD